MNINNNSHTKAKDTKSMQTRKETSDSISGRRKRKSNTSNNINNSLKQKDDQPSLQCESDTLPKRSKQTKKETKIKRKKVTETLINVSTDVTSKKRKLYSFKDDSELFKQENEDINCESNKCHLTSDMDAFDRLKIMSPYSEQIHEVNVNSNRTMKLRSDSAKVYNFSSDTDSDFSNNSKFTNRIKQKSSSVSLKESSDKKPKSTSKNSRQIKKPKAKLNNPLIDERVRKSHMEVLDTSITYIDNEELIEPNPKPQHIYPEVTIVNPTTDLNDSYTSVTSLIIEFEKPKVNSDDHFLANIKNILKKNETEMSQRNIPPQHKVDEIADVKHQQSVQDKHYEPQIEPPKSVDPTVSKLHDEVVSVEQVQDFEINDGTSSNYFQSKKSKSQRSKINTEQREVSKEESKNKFKDKSSKDFQTKKPIAKVEAHNISNTKQYITKVSNQDNKYIQKNVNISKNVNDPQPSKDVVGEDDVTILEPIKYNQEINISRMVSESHRSKNNAITESNQNANYDNLNWDVEYINTNGQQPSVSRSTVDLTTQSQEQSSKMILKNNDIISSQSLLLNPRLIQNCHNRHDVKDLSNLSNEEASQVEMLNNSEHSRTEDQNEDIIKLLNDIKKQNEKFLADVEKDTESLLDLLLLYNVKTFMEYKEECEKQNKAIINKLKTTLRKSLDENNESFKKLEELINRK